MANHFDAVVVGLGAMGGAAAHYLAKTGLRVLGLDRFQPPHGFGSSHGLTRIIREAYFENPLYVPLIRRAYDLWGDLEKQSGRQLFLKTGGLMIGPSGGDLVRGAQRSAVEHDIPHTMLNAREVRDHFPVFRPPEDFVAVWEERAGVLFPELAVRTQLELAVKYGASLCFDDPVLKWQPDGEGVVVQTGTGVYRASRLLLSAGAWTQSLLPDLDLPLVVERQTQFWFDPVSPSEAFSSGHCPVQIWQYGPSHFFYGLPDLGDGVKVAIHHQGPPVDPDNLQRNVSDGEIDAMRDLLTRFIPRANGQLRSTAVCMYTNAPDEHFVFGNHPQFPQVLIASPCSGHGFKFSPIMGELAAKMLSGQKTDYDLSPFRLGPVFKMKRSNCRTFRRRSRDEKYP